MTWLILIFDIIVYHNFYKVKIFVILILFRMEVFYYLIRMIIVLID